MKKNYKTMNQQFENTTKFMDIYTKLSKCEYDIFCETIMKPDVKMITQAFMRNLTKKQINPNMLLMSFMIHRFPSQVFTLNSNHNLSDKSFQLKKSAISLVESFQKTVNSQSPDINSFMEKYNVYKKLLKEWKEDDLHETLLELTKNYYNYVRVANDTNNVKNLIKHKEVILCQFKKFGYTKEKAFEFIRENRPKVITGKLTSIFYENFKDNLNKTPPNLHQLPELLDRLFNEIVKICKDKTTFTEEYNHLKNTESDKFKQFKMYIKLFKNVYTENCEHTLEEFNVFWKDFENHTSIDFHYSEILPKFFLNFFEIVSKEIGNN